MSAEPAPTLEDRLAVVEDALAHPKPLEERVGSLEAQLRKPKVKDGWEKAQGLAAPLAALIAAVAAFLLTGRFTLANDRAKVSLELAKEMKVYVTELEKTDVKPADARANAVALASYGPAALPALVHFLRTGGDVTLEGVRHGFRVYAATDREPACAALANVLSGRGRLFSWRHHRQAIELLADLGCRGQTPELAKYGAVLSRAAKPEGLARFNERFGTESDPPIDAGGIAELSSVLKAAQASLSAGEI